MDELRRQMTVALKRAVTPKMRELGFSGTYPNFYRKIGAEHQMLMIMFNKYGGSFYIEAGRMTQDQWLVKQQYWAAAGKQLMESSLTVGHCQWNQRMRFGGTNEADPSDTWFVFGPDKHGNWIHNSSMGSSFEAVAAKAVEAIGVYLDEYFTGQP